MNARENILLRIRSAQGKKGVEPSAEEIATARAAIARHEIGPQPPLAHTRDRVAQFRTECDKLSTTHVLVASMGDVPREVARYLRDGKLDARVVAWKSLAALDWSATDVVVDDRPANGDDRTGFTDCFCAIAETGTVLLLSSAATPKATALLPETHICVVRTSRMVDTMEESFALMRAETGEPPRATFFVSGPSRTADIEQTIVIGAHGPYRVHVVLVDN